VSLVGMMGAGKTAVGRAIAAPTSRHCAVSQPESCSIPRPVDVCAITPSSSTCAPRLKRSRRGAGRPWFSDDPAATLERLYEGCESLYVEVADLVFEAEDFSPADLAARIFAAVTE
jgi:shikimate kinase